MIHFMYLCSIHISQISIDGTLQPTPPVLVEDEEEFGVDMILDRRV